MESFAAFVTSIRKLKKQHIILDEITSFKMPRTFKVRGIFFVSLYQFTISIIKLNSLTNF